MSNALAHFVKPQEAVEIIKVYMTREPNPPDEVERTVFHIYQAKDYDCETPTPAMGVPKPVPRMPKWIIPNDPERLLRIWAGQCKLYGPNGKVWIRNEWMQGASIPTTKQFLHTQYDDEDLICVGGPYLTQAGTEKASGYWAFTVKKSSLTSKMTEEELSLLPLLVPNPMRKESGTAKHRQGDSARCMDNAATRRRYIVMDFDMTLKGDFADVIRNVIKLTGFSEREAVHSLSSHAIIHLVTHPFRKHCPLIGVVDSGGKSLHAWWCAEGLTDEEQEEFFYRAVPFGADAQLFKTNCQFARMPGGTREITGAKQEILYWISTQTALSLPNL